MEMPERFKMASRKWLKKIHSPSGAFFIGILISLFLLPCTGGPYLTILSYLASESTSINFMGYIYLLIYNLIFITPFVIITLLVSLGSADIATLKEYREMYKQEIHLVV
jgi:cytochrome c biogenesis protein CcdA